MSFSGESDAHSITLHNRQINKLVLYTCVRSRIEHYSCYFYTFLSFNSLQPSLPLPQDNPPQDQGYPNQSPPPPAQKQQDTTVIVVEQPTETTLVFRDSPVALPDGVCLQ